MLSGKSLLFFFFFKSEVPKSLLHPIHSHLFRAPWNTIINMRTGSWDWAGVRNHFSKTAHTLIKMHRIPRSETEDFSRLALHNCWGCGPEEKECSSTQIWLSLKATTGISLLIQRSLIGVGVGRNLALNWSSDERERKQAYLKTFQSLSGSKSEIKETIV